MAYTTSRAREGIRSRGILLTWPAIILESLKQSIAEDRKIAGCRGRGECEPARTPAVPGGRKIVPKGTTEQPKAGLAASRWRPDRPRADLLRRPPLESVGGGLGARGGSSRRRSRDDAVDLKKAQRSGRRRPTSRDDAVYPETMAHIPRNRRTSRDDGPHPQKSPCIPRRRATSGEIAVYPETTRHIPRRCRTSRDDGPHPKTTPYISR